MVGTHSLMESVSANLRDCLHVIDADLTRPQTKFRADGLVGALRARRPVVRRRVHKLPQQRA